MTIAIKINSHKFVTVYIQLSLVEMNRLFIVINAEAEPLTRQLAGNGVNGVRQISVKIGFFLQNPTHCGQRLFSCNVYDWSHK